MAGKPTTLGGCELDRQRSVPEADERAWARPGALGRRLPQLVGFWEVGLLRAPRVCYTIQDAVVGRWRAVVVCGGCAQWDYCEGHGPWWAWCKRVREGEGLYQGNLSRWAIAKSFPRSPASAGLRQHPKTAFSDVGCARTAGNGLTDCWASQE